jgi:hypothetical protein
MIDKYCKTISYDRKAQVNFSGPKINVVFLISVTFEINNLATSIKAKGCDKVAPG